MKWESVEFRANDAPGVRLSVSEAGVTADWGVKERVFTPTQARLLADQLRLAASEAEARGAQDWMT